MRYKLICTLVRKICDVLFLTSDYKSLLPAITVTCTSFSQSYNYPFFFFSFFSNYDFCRQSNPTPLLPPNSPLPPPSPPALFPARFLSLIIICCFLSCFYFCYNDHACSECPFPCFSLSKSDIRGTTRFVFHFIS